VLVVDHLPVPFHLCRDAAGFPTRELNFMLDAKTTQFGYDTFPAAFRDRPF